MKTFYKINILFIFIISIILFVSCSKSDKNSKLLGKWKCVNVENINDTIFIEDWEFLSSEDLNIYCHSQYPDNIPAIKWTAKYKMDTYNKFTISEFTNENLRQYNTQWEIINQKDTILMIVHGYEDGGGLYFREFVKEKE